jgi:hypothetical protein
VGPPAEPLSNEEASEGSGTLGSSSTVPAGTHGPLTRVGNSGLGALTDAAAAYA